jgi:putative hydrolase of the HAD superfamily
MRQNLIFDADDTLWENNVLFERAVEGYIDHVDHPALTREQVRAVLNDVERENSALYGYGARVFERSLTDALARLRPDTPVGEDDRAALRGLCAAILESEVEPIAGAADTLRALGERHRLFLLTKGDPADQRRKIDASGLAPLFAGVGIVREKDASAYRDFTARHALDPDTTWMIGNSVRSDVRPALDAGLGAVLVPHPLTWALERADPPSGHPRYREVDPITRLTAVF